jgi:hypothetical protein
MVTDGHQRPEIPPEDALPSPCFPGIEEYIELMNSCWKQVGALGYHSHACDGLLSCSRQRTLLGCIVPSLLCVPCAQEAKERPSFAEIIQVLRRLLADEARRVPVKPPMDSSSSSQQVSVSGGSADAVRPAQVRALQYTGPSADQRSASALCHRHSPSQALRCSPKYNVLHGWACLLHQKAWCGVQGSSGSDALRKQGSSDSMSAMGSLRSHPSNGLGDGRGGQAHLPGSPSTSGRAEEPQHARSESLGSDTHLQVCSQPCSL